ncbi:MAG TPA: quinolinate synthase NadA [Phycisphaerales bacterium]|nr:quinolinate synthase NadA [Phycisphaerales bacterium]HMP37415.1 quinolinate synthase NadA [Phycisphaerales bacterium]
MLWQPALPDRYLDATEDALGDAIARRRRELGASLIILGHHYQQDEVIRHADFTGDSLRLSQLAAAEAERRGARTIVFCGVHFMAETADILTEESVRVVLPDLSAGCSMADMAAYDDAVEAWERIHAALAGDARTRRVRVVPITYVNSSAAIKAFVGEHGGACCTSSNAGEVFDWALSGGTAPLAPDERVALLFLPDQHLGRNTASARGFLTEIDEAAGRGRSECVLYDPRRPDGGVDDERLREAKVILWAGHCSVHKLFRPEHVDALRSEYAHRGGITVLVHPECAKEVVDNADLSGSTEYIIRTIEHAPAGSNWAVGTEVHLVNRLARAAAQRGVHVRIVSDCQCLCTTMFRIDQAHLLWSLDHLAEGRIVNQVSVHPKARSLARLALDRMLANVAGRPVAVKGAALVD